MEGQAGEMQFTVLVLSAAVLPEGAPEGMSLGAGAPAGAGTGDRVSR